MTPHRILQANAASTAAGALGMLAARGSLHNWFGLPTPTLLDLVAVGLLAYAGALLMAARRHPVSRQALLAFTAADALWVFGSGVVLVLFWTELTPLARALVIAVAVVVEAFAALQFRAAGAPGQRSLGVA
jgi:hypothetical protein